MRLAMTDSGRSTASSATGIAASGAVSLSVTASLVTGECGALISAPATMTADVRGGTALAAGIRASTERGRGWKVDDDGKAGAASASAATTRLAAGTAWTTGATEVL